MAKAKSISAAALSKLTQAAVREATTDLQGKFIGKGPTMGFVLQQEMGGKEQLELAAAITDRVAANAKAAGFAGLQPKPVVVIRPGTIIAGFIGPELNVTIR